MRVVCNASPLILLAKIHRIDLLTQLYEEVIIPASVLDEILVKPGNEAEQIQARVENKTFQLRRATKRNVERVSRDLGLGEQEAIALALETTADLVILDDRQGRQFAGSSGLSITGTIGVLVEARARNLISSLRQELDHLIEAGMWIHEAAYHRILLEFGE